MQVVCLVLVKMYGDCYHHKPFLWLEEIHLEREKRKGEFLSALAIKKFSAF